MVMVSPTPLELKYLTLKGLFENEIKAKTWNSSIRSYYDGDRARKEVAGELQALVEELEKENRRQIIKK